MSTAGLLHPRRHDAGVRPNHHGFTLLELMVALTVAAVLASLALPAFGDAIRKARRSDAYQGLAAVQQAQEQWRSQRNAYAASLTHAADHATAPGLGLATAATPHGYYTLAVAEAGPSAYTLVATAVAHRSQAADGACRVLAARVSGGSLSYGAGHPSVDWTDPQRCWAR